ncbi:PREDICTED: 3beta-hydroxysteroid-dehydrogenase/decarboxylase [Prunus dulcis]|uniref:PREDICTED: 3beta-hydroxysteroid-dehydrogenase/decarboxylase n=1 Tax=Prunus dulcis TaxID=3755 RepID=A0A5E4FS82_PRUDU|nr:PREDICTED: 3beta-hydroxysteroid-dehydrogenase/decarboxylase [Prunus dulcis]
MADADELDEIVRRKLGALISRVTQEIEFRWGDECLPLPRILLHVLDPVEGPMDLVSTALQLKTRLDTHWNLQLPSIVSSWFRHTVVIALVLAFMLYSIYEQYESEVAKLLFNSIMLVFGFFRTNLPASVQLFLEKHGILMRHM